MSSRDPESVPLIIGHRGARGQVPENTVQGFEWAWSKGVRSFECDLQLSQDEQIFILHDDDLLRTTGEHGIASTLTMSALEQLDARQVGPPWREPCRIPGLDELLQLLEQDAAALGQIQLEVKTADDQTLERLCSILAARLAGCSRALIEACVVTSFNPLVPRLVAAASVSGLRCGLAIEDSGILAGVMASEQAAYDLVAVDHKLLDESVVQHFHRQGLEVSTWTVNASFDWLRVTAAGVDSIITDYPVDVRKYD